MKAADVESISQVCLGLNTTGGLAEQFENRMVGSRLQGWWRRARHSQVMSGKSKEIAQLQFCFLDLLRNFNNIYVMFLILRNVRSRYRVN